MPRVFLTKYRNLLEVSRDGRTPLDPAEYRPLARAMAYDQLVTLHGAAARDAEGNYQAATTVRKHLYLWDDRGLLVCGKGYVDRLFAHFAGLGYEVGYLDKSPPPRPGALEPRWRNLRGAGFRPFQEECLVTVAERVAAGRGGIIKAVPGFGKAQPLDSVIQTPRGPVWMGDIRIGDRVCAPNGTTRVVDIHPQGKKEIYRITFRDGAQVECCGDHLWKVDGRKRGWKAPRVVDTEYIAANYKKACGDRSFGIALPSPLQMDFRNLMIPPYVMGVLLGDGCFKGSSPGFTTADPEIARRVQEEILGSGLRVRKWNGFAYGITGEKGTINKYQREIIRLGLIARGSEDKFVPDEFLYATSRDRWALLQGLMDTDGHVSKLGAVEYSTSSPQLADDVQWLVESLGGICTRKIKKTTHLDSHRLGVIFAEPRRLFRLSRKKARTRLKTKYIPRRIIENVEKLGTKECQCITVAADDGLYLTNHCVVTHNSYLISYICQLFPKARIAISTPGVDLLDDVHDRLTETFPTAGKVGDGCESYGRVTVYTRQSLYKAEKHPVDLLLVDEVHESAAEKSSEVLGRLTADPICFGLSATPTGRLDRQDAKLEPLFGPVVFEVGWREAVAEGLVVPITVAWHDVLLRKNPAAGCQGQPRKRWGIWRNERRNEVIAQVARSYPADEQVLVMCQFVEHALFLRKALPDFELVYALSNQDRLDELAGLRELRDLGFEPEAMTRERRANLKRAFERRKLRKVIANDVWSRGVSFEGLQVLIRADARSNQVMDEQIPGRVSRIHAGKDAGYLHDFLDQFDRGFQLAAQSRRANYRAKGWHELMPTRVAPPARARIRVSS